MIPARHTFQSYSHRFVGFNNTSVFCLVFFNCATGFPVLIALKLARHCGWHWIFHLSTRIFLDILEFLIITINEINTTQSSGIVELWFLEAHHLLFFAFRRIGHIFPNVLPQSVWPGGRLFSCQSCISIPWFFIQYGESCEPCPRI